MQLHRATASGHLLRCEATADGSCLLYTKIQRLVLLHTACTFRRSGSIFELLQCNEHSLTLWGALTSSTSYCNRLIICAAKGHKMAIMLRSAMPIYHALHHTRCMTLVALPLFGLVICACPEDDILIQICPMVPTAAARDTLAQDLAYLPIFQTRPPWHTGRRILYR